MEISILNQAGEKTGKKIKLNDAIFAIEPNDHAIYLDVKQYLANNRQGTAKAKQRSENAHSTRKLGRQKGGGGARPGDLKSPVRVGGGTIFGPVPRDYSFKLNKKVKQLARRSALSLRAKQDQLIVLDALNFEAPKTKAMIEVLDKITPGIATEHTLLYGVEAKYYSAHPDMDNKLEVNGIKNLYVAGDGAGLTGGLAQASACGVYIARNIIERK